MLYNTDIYCSTSHQWLCYLLLECNWDTRFFCLSVLVWSRCRGPNSRRCTGPIFSSRIEDWRRPTRENRSENRHQHEPDQFFFFFLSLFAHVSFVHSILSKHLGRMSDPLYYHLPMTESTHASPASLAYLRKIDYHIEEQSADERSFTQGPPLQRRQYGSIILASVGGLIAIAIGSLLLFYGATQKIVVSHEVLEPLPINTVLLLVGLVVRVGSIFGGLVAGIHANAAIGRALTRPTGGATLDQLAGLSGISTEQPGEAVRIFRLTWWPIILVGWSWIGSVISKYSFHQDIELVQQVFPNITGFNARYCGGSPAAKTSLGFSVACPWSPAASIANTTKILEATLEKMNGYPYDQPFKGGLMTSPAIATDISNNFYVLPMPDLIFQGLRPGLTYLSIRNISTIKISSTCAPLNVTPSYTHGAITQGDGLYTTSWLNSNNDVVMSAQVATNNSGTACFLRPTFGTTNASWTGSVGTWVAAIDGFTPQLIQTTGYSYIADLIVRAAYQIGDLQTSTKLFSATNDGPYSVDASRVGAVAAMIYANSAFYGGNEALGTTTYYSGTGTVQRNVIRANIWAASTTGALFIALAVSALMGIVPAYRRQIKITPHQMFKAAAASEPLYSALELDCTELGHVKERELAKPPFQGRVWLTTVNRRRNVLVPM
ncbi:hypothetical protein T439DRAFT_241974 [Meredithblackwellia eburnea MCA 4105]